MGNLEDDFKVQRTIIGILGIALGFLCIFGGFIQSPTIQASISRYYYTNVREILVGTLIVSAIFLLSYKGYDSIDDVTSSIAGATALGIAFFPCLPVNYPIGERIGFFQLLHPLSDTFHLICAGIFFCSLIYIVLFLFTKSGGVVTDNKRKRNLVYLVSGSAMVVGLIITVASDLFGWPLTIFGEMIMLIFYGIAWLVKGGVALQD